MADNKFHCIILKGGDQYPYFPRPLLSEFDFSIPLTSAPAGKKKKNKKKQQRGSNHRREDEDMLDADDGVPSEEEADDDEDASDTDGETDPSAPLTQSFLLKTLQASQLADTLGSSSSVSGSARAARASLARLELDIDKTLLQLLAVECREGEERGMRALELVGLMRDRTGRMIEAAGKVAERYGRGILGEKIRELGERRVAAARDGEGEEEDSDGEFV